MRGTGNDQNKISDIDQNKREMTKQNIFGSKGP